MDNFIVLGGKKYKLIPEEEQPEKKTGNERVPEGRMYCRQWTDGICACVEQHRDIDDDLYKAANYYNDTRLATDNARADTLLRNLRRFSAEHGGIPTHGVFNKYHIIKDVNGIYTARYNGIARAFGDVWFSSEEAANLAINTFAEELRWYFFDYDPQLR